MVERKYHVYRGEATQPLPISVLIQTANGFRCNIYMEVGSKQYNVKNYDECQSGVQSLNRNCVLCFDGSDEQEAEGRFRTLFGGQPKAV